MSRDSSPTRAAILGSAARLLEAGGPGAVTMRAVGDAAGVSRGAPYRHFEDKAALLRALAEATLEGLGDAVRAALAPGPGGVLRRGCAAYVAFALSRPHHYLLVFGDQPVPGEALALERAADEGMRAIRDLVVEAQAEGELPPGDPRHVATLVWALAHGIAQLRITGHLRAPRTTDGDTELDTLIDVAIAALRPSQ